jgi:HK97 family phage prohead protease
MNQQIEKRYLDMPPEALVGEGGIPIIRGTSPVFNAISEVIVDSDLGMFREVIEPQAFDKLFEKGMPDVRGRMDHKIILGRTKNGTMTLRKTEAGIEYEIFVNPSDPEAMGAYEKVRRKDVDGASFMFTVAPDGEKWEMRERIPLRRVYEIDELMDVGPVTFPAYPQASANARSKVQELRQQQQEPTPPEGAEGESLLADQKAAQDDQTLELMAMEIEIDQIKE